jgi:hypothetical protein
MDWHLTQFYLAYRMLDRPWSTRPTGTGTATSCGRPSQVMPSHIPDPAACRPWRRFALGRLIVDFGLLRTTIWCRQPCQHDHGGSDEGPVPDLL